MIGYIKRTLHRDICRDPVLHGLVLNLYLNGEQYPHRVDDYFPLDSVEDGELRDSMCRHMREEDKHVALYRKAIARLDQPVVELALDNVYNEVIRRHTKTCFRMDVSDSSDQRRAKLANFLAHLHFLEKRIARSLDYHLDACPVSPSEYAGKAVAAVHRDEQRHVKYTLEAVKEILPTARATAVLAHHEAAESAANRAFSARQLELLTKAYADRFPPARRRLYRCASRLLDWSHRYV